MHAHRCNKKWGSMLEDLWMCIGRRWSAAKQVGRIGLTSLEIQTRTSWQAVTRDSTYFCNHRLVPLLFSSSTLLPFLPLPVSGSLLITYGRPKSCAFSALISSLLPMPVSFPTSRSEENSLLLEMACSRPFTPLKIPHSFYEPGACGKTSLLCSFALGEFPRDYVRPSASVP